MDGIYVNVGGRIRRPKSKKEIRDQIKADPDSVSIDQTALIARVDYDGISVAELPDGDYHFVGPDPYTKRSFYGTIVKRGAKVVVK